MVSPTNVLVAWICTVSYPHTHRHARCTLLTQPKIHLSAVCLGMCMPKRAGTAQASVCPLPPVSSVMEPDAGMARMCTPYLPSHAPSCTKRTTRKLKIHLITDGLSTWQHGKQLSRLQNFRRMVLRNTEVGRRKLGLSAASRCCRRLPLVNFLVPVIPDCSGEIGLAQQLLRCIWMELLCLLDFSCWPAFW